MGAPGATRVGTSSSPHDETKDDGLHKPPAVASSNTTTSQDSTAASTSDIYLSLIQQYLSVFMVDNATFLAERCVAEFPDCAEAVYLQALCYYRAGQPKRACHVLERMYPSYQPQQPVDRNKEQQQQQQQQYHQENNSANDNTSGSTSSFTGISLVTPTAIATAASMLYLSAVCSYELKEYSAAEDFLLQETRTAFKQHHRGALPTLGVGQQQDSTSAGALMEEWILKTSVRVRRDSCVSLYLYM
jgi:FtsZ-interacting cell division protein YlmF